jgi:phage FluMu gp28-like protein
LFVAVVLERVSGLLILRELVARKNASFAEQDAVLDDLMRRYHVVLCQMDQTGMGEKPVEDARRRYGSRVAGVIFSGPSKQRMALAAKQAFESRTVKIPIANAALRSDLHAIKREFSDTGQPRFIADRDSNGHADRAWALFLAIDAATRPPALYAYEPVIALGYRRSLDAPDNDDHRQARWGRLG